MNDETQAGEGTAGERFVLGDDGWVDMTKPVADETGERGHEDLFEVVEAYEIAEAYEAQAAELRELRGTLEHVKTRARAQGSVHIEAALKHNKEMEDATALQLDTERECEALRTRADQLSADLDTEQIAHRITGDTLSLVVDEEKKQRTRADQLETETEQARVQLAGCLTAAEGVGVDSAAKQGDYGWSLAYQKTLDLRQEYEDERAAVEMLEWQQRTLSTRADQAERVSDQWEARAKQVKARAEARITALEGERERVARAIEIHGGKSTLLMSVEAARRATPTPEPDPVSEESCGDCRLPIREACRCSENLRICEEQQRAERAEALAPVSGGGGEKVRAILHHVTDYTIGLRWHDGNGWYYVDENYPDEGSVGAFSTREEAVTHGEAADYYFDAARSTESPDTEPTRSGSPSSADELCSEYKGAHRCHQRTGHSGQHWSRYLYGGGKFHWGPGTEQGEG